MSNRTSQADRKGKGKALAVPKHFRKPLVRIIDGQEGVSLETISLQDTLQAEAITEDMTGEIWLSHKATWYESFGDADRVYERTGDRYDPYPGLLINTETEDPVIRDPLWLSEMLEARFISKLVITSAIQISLFPKVIQEAAAQIEGLNYMKMEIWSTLPVWDTSYYMES
nr:hypothetical protein CFP56_45405 [Quercus suber]